MRGHRGGHHSSMDETLAMLAISTEGDKSKEILVNVVESFKIDNTGRTPVSAKLNAAFVALIAIGVGAGLPAGTYLFDAPVDPAGLPVWLDPGVKIVSTIPSGSGVATDSVFASSYSTTSFSTTLASTPAAGSQTVQLVSTAGLVRGTYIMLTQAQTPLVRNAMFRVDSIAGAVVTLDRPLIMPGFMSGDTVTGIVPVLGVNIYGNGAQIVGTGSRYIEMYGAWKANIRDLQLLASTTAGSPSERLMSLDVPSYDCRATGILGDAGGTVPIGGSVESAESCVYEHCEWTRATSVNLFFQDATACYAIACKGSAGTVGVVFGGGVDAHTNSLGSVDCAVIGGDFSSNVNAAAWNTCTARCKLIGVSASSSTGDVFSVGGAVAGLGGRATDNGIYSCAANGSPNDGVNMSANVDRFEIADSQLLNMLGGAAVVVPAGATSTKITGVDVTGSITAFDVSSDVVISGLTGVIASASTVAALQRSGATVLATGINLTFAPTVGAYCINALGGTGRYTNMHLSIGAGSIGVITNGAGAVACVEQTKIEQSAGGAYGLYANVGTIRIGSGVDVDATTTPLTVTAVTGFCNRKQSVTAAPGGTAVSWPDLKSTDEVILIPKAATFTGYVSSYTPGTGFTVTDAASGTYEYCIP